MNEINRQLIVSENTNTPIYAMIPPSFLLKSALTDLYAEIEERKPIQILQILRISQISQYTEVKSENTLKKSKDLQGFHQYIPEYSDDNLNVYIYQLLITKIEHQTNTDYCCPLK